MRIKRGSLSAHLKVISKGIDINKPLDRFLPAQSLPGCLSKPNAKSRWEASIKCSEGRWRVQEESCLSHDAQQLLNARLPQIERSALKHRCVRKRGRVRGRVIHLAIFSVSTKTAMDLKRALDVSGKGIFRSHVLFPGFILAEML